MKYITVNKDKYCGAYSKAKYTAWEGDAPEGIDGCDTTCNWFWKENYIQCGKGDTEENAILDLLNKLGSNHIDNDIKLIGTYDVIYRECDVRGEDIIIKVFSKKYRKLYPNLEQI